VSDHFMDAYRECIEAFDKESLNFPLDNIKI
jgi:hypothetical protein